MDRHHCFPPRKGCSIPSMDHVPEASSCHETRAETDHSVWWRICRIGMRAQAHRRTQALGAKAHVPRRRKCCLDDTISLLLRQVTRKDPRPTERKRFADDGRDRRLAQIKTFCCAMYVCETVEAGNAALEEVLQDNRAEGTTLVKPSCSTRVKKPQTMLHTYYFADAACPSLQNVV